MSSFPGQFVSDPRLSPPERPRTPRVGWDAHPPALGGLARVQGKFLRVAGRPFWARGVTYGSFAPDGDGEPFPPTWRVRDDFARMTEAGINTVRLYSPPPDRVADAAAAAGLLLLPDICWGPRTCELDTAEHRRIIRDFVRGHARRLADHPAILFFSLGNEIPPLIVRWYGRQRIEAFVRDLHETVKEEAPQRLTTYCNHPPTEYLDLRFLDVLSFNVYLERERDFRRYLDRLHVLAGEKPLFLSEIGADSRTHGPEGQARMLEWQLVAAVEKGACGAAVYGWTDEWSMFDRLVEGWAFGLTDARRRPKPALEAVGRIYRTDRFALRPAWPRVSVVVASYNGASTLGECLDSLARLDYPDYEVIVVDDGSRDHTPDIIAGRDLVCVRVPNGGLSRARNLGIQAATGEIVAFIDSDAHAEPEWLYHLVTAMEEQGAAGAGGPNLPPPGDPFVSHCVDFAPGNPSHVLLDDALAEHVPGCNMAFRRSELLRIGMFDPTYRIAGDDVDVCWKLLVRSERIAYSPCAVVWHHRRATVRTFLKQQYRYGYAEALLQRRYPGRFNVFGDLVWKGGIYDSPSAAMRTTGVPRVFRPRIYHGVFCGGSFQSLYQPFLTWWFQVFTTAEWQLLSWSVLASGLLALAASLPAALGLLTVSVLMAGTTVAAAGVAASHAARHERWSGAERWRAALLVGWLHVVQPLSRSWGRLRGWWHARRSPPHAGPEERVWGNVEQRHEWLLSLQRHARDCGWRCEPCGEWDDADLEITGPGPCVVRLVSTCEEQVERGEHYVRYRVFARNKRSVPFLWLGCLALLACFVLFPFLLPLALPAGFLAYCLVSARRAMVAAVSQMALDCAEAMDMPRC